MPTTLKFGSTAPAAVHLQVQLLGTRLRVARKRRHLTLRDVAAKAGIAYDTARAVEKGNIQTGIGAYLAHAWALGLVDKFADLLKPEDDTEGNALDIAKLPERVRHQLVRDDDF